MRRYTSRAGGSSSPFTSRNLTPDSGLPAGLTFDQFQNVLHTGTDPDNPLGQPLQIMPWPVYGNMVDRDATPICEYLHARSLRASTTRTLSHDPGAEESQELREIQLDRPESNRSSIRALHFG